MNYLNNKPLMRKIITGLPIFCSLLLVSCRNDVKPDGLPKLYSCRIGITQDSRPVEGILVSLRDSEQMGKWSISGRTDASGMATIRTHGNFKGVPSGRYKVVLTKNEMEYGPEASPVGGPAWTKVYSLIEKKYTDLETTPLEISVENKSVTFSFEAGPPVRREITSSGP